MSNLNGLKVKDRITGFTGIVTGTADYLSGYKQYQVSPAMDKDGKVPDPIWYDEQRLEVLEGERIFLDNGKTPGCDRAPPKR